MGLFEMNDMFGKVDVKIPEKLEVNFKKNNYINPYGWCDRNNCYKHWKICQKNNCCEAGEERVKFFTTNSEVNENGFNKEKSE